MPIAHIYPSMNLEQPQSIFVSTENRFVKHACERDPAMMAGTGRNILLEMVHCCVKKFQTYMYWIATLLTPYNNKITSSLSLSPSPNAVSFHAPQLIYKHDALLFF